MADYHPLISRAVGALEKNSGENRRVIYDRARAALLAQLRGVTPALDESDITRERLALEESIRKVEAESARQFVEATRQMPAAKLRQSRQWEAPKPRIPESRPAEPAPAQESQRYIHPPAPAAAPEPAAPPQPPRAAASPPSIPEAEEADSIFERPFPAEPQPIPMGETARRAASARGRARGVRAFPAALRAARARSAGVRAARGALSGGATLATDAGVAVCGRRFASAGSRPSRRPRCDGRGVCLRIRRVG